MTKQAVFRNLATAGMLGGMLAASRLVEAQVAVTVIDSAPRKLYTELYSDEGGNQFLVEVFGYTPLVRRVDVGVHETDSHRLNGFLLESSY